LDEFLAQIREETGTLHALVLGGDIASPVGPFSSARRLVETGLFAKHGFRALGFATYPEAHPKISADDLDNSLELKLQLANAQGLKTWLVSQFCFDSAPILTHVERLRGRGVTSPVHVGVAGPTSRKSLLKYAMLCGIGNSIRALNSQSQRLGHLLTAYEPDDLIVQLARAAHDRPSLLLEKVHFFAFGGIEKTAKWCREVVGTGRVQ
jgi:methylenetetrahydrofolate reductase (NADPH)